MDPFRDLYERYHADVYRFALVLTGDHSSAQDRSGAETVVGVSACTRWRYAVPSADHTGARLTHGIEMKIGILEVESD